MKRVIFAAFVLAALPRLAAAQVEKQVEVTKAYVLKGIAATAGAKAAIEAAGGKLAE